MIFRFCIQRVLSLCVHCTVYTEHYPSLYTVQHTQNTLSFCIHWYIVQRVLSSMYTVQFTYSTILNVQYTVYKGHSPLCTLYKVFTEHYPSVYTHTLYKEYSPQCTPYNLHILLSSMYAIQWIQGTLPPCTLYKVFTEHSPSMYTIQCVRRALPLFVHWTRWSLCLVHT